MEDSFEKWVERLRARYGSMRAVAEQIGMTESGFFRGVKRGTLSVENLLDLARVTEEHPSTILRLAGKASVAELIEKLYGAGRDALKESERTVIELWNHIDDAQARDTVLVVMRRFADAFGPLDGDRGVGRATRGGTRRSAHKARVGRTGSKE